MNEPISTPIPADEQQQIARDDIVTLLSADILCPLARRIEEALVKLDLAMPRPPQPTN